MFAFANMCSVHDMRFNASFAIFDPIEMCRKFVQFPIDNKRQFISHSLSFNQNFDVIRE